MSDFYGNLTYTETEFQRQNMTMKAGDMARLAKSADLWIRGKNPDRLTWEYFIPDDFCFHVETSLGNNWTYEFIEPSRAIRHLESIQATSQGALSFNLKMLNYLKAKLPAEGGAK